MTPSPILKNSFWQLMLIYTAIILLVVFGIFSKYAIQFNILAIIIGIIGAFSLKHEKEAKINKKVHYFLLIIALILIFVLRIIPYLNNSIPLGYDPGIYKYGIEHGLENKDIWILQGGMEPGFLYLMQPFHLLFSTDFILKYILIAFCILLGLAVYLVSKEYFNKTAAVISVFIYALSIIQFKTFWFMYYKNIIALSTMLFSLYFLKKYEKENRKAHWWLFMILAGLTGAIHRPTFYILGLSYFVYAFVLPYSNKKYNAKLLGRNIFSLAIIVLIAGIFYIGDFSQAITGILPWVAKGFIEPGQSPGTFINFFTYQYSILPYFALAVLGLIFCIKKKLGMLEIWAVLNLVIVYFQFFFFNRFIIFLDVVLIIFASFGFSLLIENRKRLGTLLTILLIFSLGAFAMTESINSKPLIDSSELQVISNLSQITPQNAFVMSTSSIYSTWIQGYSGRKTIAPGLFDYDKHNKDEWTNFWATSDISEIKQFLSVYDKPLYIFIGKQQADNLAQFNSSGCFATVLSDEGGRVYNYSC